MQQTKTVIIPSATWVAVAPGIEVWQQEGRGVQLGEEGVTWRIRTPDPVTPVEEEEEDPACPRCGSRRWVSVSLDGGYSRRAQCVPCGQIGHYLGPGWKAGG